MLKFLRRIRQNLIIEDNAEKLMMSIDSQLDD